ncbi:MAG: hypothetical protein HZB65_01480 [Candidatus Aenigmarchaeota archaeon]|nr:hypothetical protein [Candidatus Aenigmarchaeota archaeon]
MYSYPLFKEKMIIPSKEAQYEMDELELDLWKIKEILEQGYDASLSKRGENTIERAMIRKDKEIRVVVVLVERKDISYWVIKHVGKTSRH